MAHSTDVRPRPAYREVEHLYWLNLDRHDPDAILTAQNANVLDPKRERDGTITVSIPKAGRMTWGAAVPAGFIGPRR